MRDIKTHCAWLRDHGYSRRGMFGGSFLLTSAAIIAHFVRSTIGLIGDGYASCSYSVSVTMGVTALQFTF